MINELILLKMPKTVFTRILSLLEDIDDRSTPGNYETTVDASISHKIINERCSAIHDILIKYRVYDNE